MERKLVDDYLAVQLHHDASCTPQSGELMGVEELDRGSMKSGINYKQQMIVNGAWSRGRREENLVDTASILLPMLSGPRLVTLRCSDSVSGSAPSDQVASQ